MKRLILGAIVAALVPAFASAAPVAKPGELAPDFKVKDAKGKEQTLSAQKGKWVVLEWYNKDCPFVKKHYGSKNMQALQEKYTGKGVTWFQVISSAKGEQGYLTPKEAIKVASAAGTKATATLLDESGAVGKSYDALTTPHMFIVNPEGVLVYAGGIDDKNSPNPDVIAQSTNFVATTLDTVLAGGKVEPFTQPHYGCGIKYKK